MSQPDLLTPREAGPEPVPPSLRQMLASLAEQWDRDAEALNGTEAGAVAATHVTEIRNVLEAPDAHLTHLGRQIRRLSGERWPSEEARQAWIQGMVVAREIYLGHSWFGQGRPYRDALEEAMAGQAVATAPAPPALARQRPGLPPHLQRACDVLMECTDAQLREAILVLAYEKPRHYQVLREFVLGGARSGG